MANGLVRMNTTGLLCDAFPLADATMTQEERAGLMEKQYQAILTLLTDPCHLVRITAIKVSPHLFQTFLHSSHT